MRIACSPHAENEFVTRYADFCAVSCRKSIGEGTRKCMYKKLDGPFRRTLRRLRNEPRQSIIKRAERHATVHRTSPVTGRIRIFLPSDSPLRVHGALLRRNGSDGSSVRRPPVRQSGGRASLCGVRPQPSHQPSAFFGRVDPAGD
jgi:hypothetical protein